eukprot:Gb_35726 [translate_table: standard]
MADEDYRRRLPRRIILVRHGESEGNLDDSMYTRTPDHQIGLTAEGMEQAEECGKNIRKIIEKGGSEDWRVYFYVSPYKRTLCTLKGIGRAFERERIIGVREECRIREQDFGNFQEEERMKIIKQTRQRFGRFFYRFPEGESAADVFDRVTSFLESLWRDIDMNRINRDGISDLNLVIVSHGLTSRVFLMRWFKWTAEQFELLNNPRNCEIRVMQLGCGGEYSLAVEHGKEELQDWGLSSDMIADQEWRASAKRGQWNDDCPWFHQAFFDRFKEDHDHDVGGNSVCHMPNGKNKQGNSHMYFFMKLCMSICFLFLLVEMSFLCYRK